MHCQCVCATVHILAHLTFGMVFISGILNGGPICSVKLERRIYLTMINRPVEHFASVKVLHKPLLPVSQVIVICPTPCR